MVEYVYTILIGHFIADFVHQPRYMAEKKGYSIKALFSHAWLYACFMIFFIRFASFIWNMPVTDISRESMVLVFGYIFLSHGLVDFVSSKVTRKLWEARKNYWFFVVIGFDQLVHYISLLVILEFV